MKIEKTDMTAPSGDSIMSYEHSDIAERVARNTAHDSKLAAQRMGVCCAVLLENTTQLKVKARHPQDFRKMPVIIAATVHNSPTNTDPLSVDNSCSFILP